MDKYLEIVHPIAKYLMSSYAYYVEDNPIISDNEFDNLAEEIYKDWDSIEHMHKHLLDKEMLKAGTYLGEYPNMVKGAVKSYRNMKGLK